MGRRNDIDWQKVERLYVANQLTVRQIAEECGINPSSITAHAKNGGWKRDISAAIKASTKAKISAIDVAELIEQSATENAQKSAQTLKKAIEQASDVAAGVILRHRASYRLQIERGDQLEAEFDRMLPTCENIGDVAKAAVAYKSIVESKAKLVSLERESFGLDAHEPSDERDVEAMPAADAWKVSIEGLS